MQVHLFREASCWEGRPRSLVGGWDVCGPAAAQAGRSHCPEPSAHSWVLCPRPAFNHICSSACCPSGCVGLSLPALPLRIPVLELVLGNLLSEALPSKPQGRPPRASCSPVQVFRGLTFRAAQDVLSRVFVAAVCASHMACLPCQSLAVPSPASVSLAEPSCPWNRGAKGCIEV